jgi:hypothetical protein
MQTRGSRFAIAMLACTLALAGAATALAAHPKKGAHFKGSFGFTGINGFKPPVAFTVAHDGKTLTAFTYSTLGCFGGGGFQPGVDYYTKPSAMIKVGTVKVSSSGHFSVKGVVATYTISGYTTKTTTTLSGKFTSAKAATGTLTFSQTYTPGAHSCNSNALTFSAKG